MEAIFHEKQEGSLCAQHCLNALLQGSYFTPVDLATLAQQMDDEERLRMAESGEDSEDYRRFLEQPSGNYDDSGYFSVQVISSALEVWGLELVPYNSTEPRALEAQQCPEAMQAFICNYRDHWFTVRRLGHQWFNLNSLLTGPELISNTYLAMFLAQLQQEGYSIFIVLGSFPECEADSLLRLVPAVQTVKPRRLSSVKTNNVATNNVPVATVTSNQNRSSEEDLQRALKLSLGSQEVVDQDAPLQAALSLSMESTKAETVSNESKSGQDDQELQRALSLSIKGHEQSSPPAVSIQNNSVDDEEAELQKALRLSLQNSSPGTEQEDLDLEKALKMSLECCDPSSSSSHGGSGASSSSGCGTCDLRNCNNTTVESQSTSNNIDAEDIRRKRLAYLEANARQNTSAATSNGGTSKYQVNT